jgi:hypothetical protein
MTTKENVRKKTLDLLDDVHQELIKKLDILLDSGAIDYESEALNLCVSPYSGKEIEIDD